MMKNFSLLMFFIVAITGTLISISSNSWLGAWMGLEINLLSFIPLLINLKNSLSTESALKYFLTQALASSILLFSIIMINFEFYNTNSYINLILNSSLMLKMGAAPFHFWFPEMMEGLSWNMSFMLMTWQKIAPMIMIFYCLINFYSYMISIMSIILGSLGGLNQISLRKLMAYSSINHLGWLLSCLTLSSIYWLIYFLFYCLILFSVTNLLNKYNMFYINQIYNLMKFNPLVKFILFCNLLSLGGLPPFTGFLPKWIIIQSLVNINLFLVGTMVIFTLITLYFYIRMTYAGFLINYTELKWMNFIEMNLNHSLILNMFSIMFLPVITMIWFIF